jgi:pimeloyl-ACP methyl ester carboxylesterase
MADGLLLIHAFPLDSDVAPRGLPDDVRGGRAGPARLQRRAPAGVVTMASAADQCLATLDIGRGAVIAGLSMGGYVARA